MRVTHSGGQHDDGGVRTQVAGNTQQAANDQGNVGASHAAPVVQLIDDDVTQGSQQSCPPLMSRQHDKMQVIRIGQDDVGMSARPVLRLAWCITIRRTHAHSPLRALRRVDPLVQCAQLVGGKRLRGGQVQQCGPVVHFGDTRRPVGCGVVGQIGQNRHPCDQRLPGASPGGDNCVLPGVHGVQCAPLVLPHVLDTQVSACVCDGGVDPPRPRCGACWSCRNAVNVDQPIVTRTNALQHRKKVVDARAQGRGRPRRTGTCDISHWDTTCG